MSFLNPWAFLLLAAVPALVLLYFLKLKRPTVRVPSTLLWQKMIEDQRVNSPFQRLRRSLLLLLQLLALLAAIAALTRPLLRARPTVGESLIAILDTSASMSAVEENGRTRLELAKAALAKLVDRLPAGDELMLIAFNSRARVACEFSSNKRALREILATVEPTDCPSEIEPALLLARSICSARGRPRVLLFSDGAFTAPKACDMPVEIEYQPIGTPRPNLAITGLNLRRSLKARDRTEMFVAVENFSDKPFAGNMNVQLDGVPLDSKYFSVAAGETLSQIFEAALPGGGVISIEYDVADALRCDNRAWRIISPAVGRRVVLVGDNTFFLERAFQAAPGIACAAISAQEYSGKNIEGSATVIWNAVAHPAVAPCNNIYLGCFPEIEGLKTGPAVGGPAVMDWDTTHPVNRFLDFDNLVIASARSFELPGQAAVVMRSSQAPLAAVFEHGAGGICVVGFDPLKSNWPLLVSFPLFLNNCLDHFDDLQRRKTEANIAVGGAITMPASAAAPVLELPDGRRQAMRRTAAGDYSFADVSRCGLYQVRSADGAVRPVAANLFDRQESRLDIVENPPVGGKQVKLSAAGKQVDREFWKSIAIFFAALLLVEWIVYHRRLFA